MINSLRALKRRLRLRQHMRVARAMHEVKTRRINPRPHGMENPLIVSLTSYPARFPTLALTLKALLRQSVQADRTILWLTEDEAKHLPREVISLQSQGLEIRSDAPQIRSYKKIIPALEAYPDANIVTADDDTYYGPEWLGQLTTLAQPGRIVAHRTRLIQRTSTGLAPYSEWSLDISGPTEGTNILATGVGGILYSAHSLHSDTVQQNLFTRLCPSADDIWLWWMARLANSVVRHVGPPMQIITWPGSQETSLWSENSGLVGGNDRAISAMIEHYGLPEA